MNKNELTMTNKVTIRDKASKLSKYLRERKLETILLLYALFYPINSVYAADAKWKAFTDFIIPWIERLGGVILLIGAVEFGIAFKQDDADGKTKGTRAAVAGCIVIAVGLSSSTFLY